MGAEIAGHILPKEFYRDMNLFLQGMGQRTLDYVATINGINNLIGDAITDDKKIIANHSIPQDTLEQAHDLLLSIMDDRLFCLTHLVKINAFIPHLIDKFGPVIRYDDPTTMPKSMPVTEVDGNICRYDFSGAAMAKHHNQTQSVNYWEVNLPVFCTEKNLWNEIGALLSSGYTHLNSLRHLMSRETVRRREDDITRDSFCTNFLYGKETNIPDSGSRMEYQYFIRNGFPLGVLETSPKVAKWLATERRKPARYERTFDYLSKMEQGVILPAVYCFHLEGGSPTPDMVRTFARNTSGIIPESGIFIGNVQQKPQPSKPRLVNQPAG